MFALAGTPPEIVDKLSHAIKHRGTEQGVQEKVAAIDIVVEPDTPEVLAQRFWREFTQLRSGTFTVAVCDLGCGYRATIAETLPEKFVAQLAAALAGSNRDSDCING